MSDFLDKLLARTFRPVEVRPRSRSPFETLAEPDRIADPAPQSGEHVPAPDRPDRGLGAPRSPSFAESARAAGPASGPADLEPVGGSGAPAPASAAGAGAPAWISGRPARSRTADESGRASSPPPPGPAAQPRRETGRAPAPSVDPPIRPAATIPAPGPTEEVAVPRPARAGDGDAVARKAPTPPAANPASPPSDAARPIPAGAPRVAETRPARERSGGEDGVLEARPVALARPDSPTAEAAALAHPESPTAEGAAPDAPTIRVSIGRLEVRAPQSSERPARRAAELRRPAMSLEEYLRRRDSGQG